MLAPPDVRHPGGPEVFADKLGRLPISPPAMVRADPSAAPDPWRLEQSGAGPGVLRAAPSHCRPSQGDSTTVHVRGAPCRAVPSDWLVQYAALHAGGGAPSLTAPVLAGLTWGCR
jgi:hypothetical protein